MFRKALLIVSSCLWMAYAQEQNSAAPQPPADQQQTQTADQNQTVDQKQTPEGEASRSATTVQPAPPKPLIKTPELERRPVHPVSRIPKYVFSDQKRIWTSPFHINKKNAKWWVLTGGVTAALIATDRTTSRELPNTKDQLGFATWTSRIGAAYTLIPITGAFYVVGTVSKNEHFRETGILAAETLIDTTLVETVIKAATHRERPLEGNGNGNFWSNSGSVWNASFPSGHAINSFALATVIAHEYSDVKVVPYISYGLATVVCGSRFAARKHFASDIVLGSVMGWFIGDYVYHKRHNPNTENASVWQKVLSHVNLNIGIGM